GETTRAIRHAHRANRSGAAADTQPRSPDQRLVSRRYLDARRDLGRPGGQARPPSGDPAHSGVARHGLTGRDRSRPPLRTVAYWRRPTAAEDRVASGPAHTTDY